MSAVKPTGRFLCFLILFAGIALSAMSQRSHLSKRITLSYASVRLDDALQEIARAGNFSFSYNADLINSDSLVTFQVEDAKVSTLLGELLGDRIRNKEVGNHIILLQTLSREEKKESKRKSGYIISGYIQDLHTGHRLSDATIYEVSKRKTVLSNSSGHYSFPLPAGREIHGLYFAKRGYADTVIFIRPVRDYSLDMPMKPLYADILRVSSLPAELQVNLIDSLALVNMLVPRKALITSENLQVYRTRAFHVSLIPYVGTNRMSKGAYTNAISFNLLAGYTGGVNGFELGGLVNIVRKNVRGFQLGGLGNIVGRNMIGFQFGGIFNVNLGHFKGFQLGGLMNYQKDTLTGIQIVVFCNYLDGKMRGVQLGGLLNITTGHVYGLQLAGFVNIASGNMNGVQVAGLVNYAKNVNGLQVGGFNIAKTVESGIPIGFFSYVLKGGLHHMAFYGDEVFYGNVAFRTGTKRFYNTFQVGIGTTWMVNYMYGIGTSFRMGEKLTFSVDIISGLVFSTTPNLALHGTLTKLLPAVEYRFRKHFALFAGPTYNLYAFDVNRTVKPNGIAPYTFFNQVKGRQRIQMWIGGTIGFRF